MFSDKDFIVGKIQRALPNSVLKDAIDEDILFALLNIQYHRNFNLFYVINN